MKAAALLLLAVAAQRGAELLLAHRNTRRLMAHGAVEHAPGHYPLIVATHAGWLAALWACGRDQKVRPSWLAAFLALQAGRAWVLGTLKERWTTRIVTIPGETLVARGPYRYLRHPNYAVVAGEMLTLPMALGLPRLALVFSALNAAVTTVRIRAEDQALQRPKDS